jgi:hypothetical protein
MIWIHSDLGTLWLGLDPDMDPDPHTVPDEDLYTEKGARGKV